MRCWGARLCAWHERHRGATEHKRTCVTEDGPYERELVELAPVCQCLAVLATQTQARCTAPKHVLRHSCIYRTAAPAPCMRWATLHTVTRQGRAPQRLQASAYTAASSALRGQSANALNSLRTALTKAPKLRSALSVACSSWMPATSGRHCVTAPQGTLSCGTACVMLHAAQGHGQVLPHS